MKFENIKVGDTVFIEERVEYAYRSGKSFTIPVTVTKVTKTQFTVESGQRFKKDGRMIGGGLRSAYYEGEKMNWYDDTTVTDQTKEMEYFKQKLAAERRINNQLEKLKCPANSELTYDELISITKLLIQVDDKLNQREVNRVS